MTLTEIKAALKDLGRAPTQSLGQNFLHDQNLAQWLINQACLSPEDHVVEIGPGLGALTEYIVASGAKVTLIEKDGILAEYLERKFGSDRVRVIHEDAVKFDTRQLFKHGPVKVISNLPYYVTTPVLLQFASTASPADQVFIMVQKELGLRLSAEPRTKDYGRLTLMLQRRWQVEYLKTVPPSVFIPAPKVESALVKLTLRPPGEIDPCDESAFARLVKMGFSQRRKQLRKMLKTETDDWSGLTAQLGVLETVRAEELSLQEWVQLTNILTPAPAGTEDSAQEEIFDVVDANDQVLDSKPRKTVHVNNLRHRAVHIFLYNKNGELYLQKRSHRKDRHPSVWDSSAAGHVDSGETYDTSAVRELKEELGVEVDELQFVGKIDACEETGQEFVHIYRCQYDGKIRIALDEIEFGHFFPVSEISEWIQRRPQDFAPGFVACFKIAPPPSSTEH